MGKTGKLIIALIVVLILAAIIYFVFFRKAATTETQRLASSVASSNLSAGSESIIQIQNEDLKNRFNSVPEYSRFVAQNITPNIGKIIVTDTEGQEAFKLLEVLKKPNETSSDVLLKVSVLKSGGLYFLSKTGTGNYFLSKIKFAPGSNLSLENARRIGIYFDSSNVKEAFQSAIINDDLSQALPRSGETEFEQVFGSVQ